MFPLIWLFTRRILLFLFAILGGPSLAGGIMAVITRSPVFGFIVAAFMFVGMIWMCVDIWRYLTTLFG
jgi:hypothetical protein